jgi:hypothetical protein
MTGLRYEQPTCVIYSGIYHEVPEYPRNPPFPGYPSSSALRQKLPSGESIYPAGGQAGCVRPENYPPERCGQVSPAGRGLPRCFLARCGLLFAFARRKVMNPLTVLLRGDGLVTALLALYGHQEPLLGECRQQEARRAHRPAMEEIALDNRGDGLPGGYLGDRLLDVVQGDPFQGEESVADVPVYAQILLAVRQGVDLAGQPGLPR